MVLPGKGKQKNRKDKSKLKQNGKRQKDNVDWNKYFRRNESEDEITDELLMVKEYDEANRVEDDECVFGVVVLLTKQMAYFA